MTVDYNLMGRSVGKMGETIFRAFTYSVAHDKPCPGYMVWGAPGVGKTFGIYEAVDKAKEFLKREVDIACKLISTMEPVDLSGVPGDSKLDGLMQYKPFEWIHQFSTDVNGPPGIIFLDDIVTAHPQTQAAMFKFVHERMAGDKRIRPNVMFIGAGNRPEDNSAAVDMPKALASRFRHLYVKPDAEDWLDWADRSGIVHPLMIGYLSMNKQNLHDFNPDDPEPAYACPRSWHMVSDLLYEVGIRLEDLNALHAEKKRREFSSLYQDVAGIVGSAQALTFDAYVTEARAAIPPEVIVKDPMRAPVPGNNMEAAYATVSALNWYFRGHLDKWRPIIQYTSRDGILPEIGVLAARSILKAIQDSRIPKKEQVKIMSDDLFIDWKNKYAKLLIFPKDNKKA